MRDSVQAPQTEERLMALHKEVEALEGITLVAIEDFEKQLNSLEDIADVSGDKSWSPRLDVIEIYSMEKRPTLSESIRQISPVEY